VSSHEGLGAAAAALYSISPAAQDRVPAGPSLTSCTASRVVADAREQLAAWPWVGLRAASISDFHACVLTDGTGKSIVLSVGRLFQMRTHNGRAGGKRWERRARGTCSEARHITRNFGAVIGRDASLSLLGREVLGAGRPTMAARQVDPVKIPRESWKRGERGAGGRIRHRRQAGALNTAQDAMDARHRDGLPGPRARPTAMTAYPTSIWARDTGREPP